MFYFIFVVNLAWSQLMSGWRGYPDSLNVSDDVVDQDVAAFLKENASSDKTVKASVKRDALGRVSQDSLTYVSSFRDKKIKVVVSKKVEDFPFIGAVSGRYESSVEGKRGKYWLNGDPIDESTYLKKYDAVRKEMRSMSVYRPPEIRYMSADEIQTLLDGPDVVSIRLYKEPSWNSLDTVVGGRVFYRDSLIREMSQIQSHAFGNGYKGAGVGVYFTETGCPDTRYINLLNYTPGNYRSGYVCPRGVRTHPTGVVRVLQSTAPDAMIYGFDQENLPINPMDYDIPLYIGSHSWEFKDDSVYSAVEQEFDNYVYNNGVIEFIAAGNRLNTSENSYVSSPGRSLNSITVGAIDPDTYGYTSYSRWKNPSLKYQKPEVVNFSHFWFLGDAPFSKIEDGRIKWYNGTFDGTSASTPYTAAMAADVLSQHPFFKTHPETFKPLIMTAGVVSITNSGSKDTDNYLRIKKIPLYSGMGWNTRSAYWNGNNSSFFDSNSEITFWEENIESGKNYRIAISWLSNGDHVVDLGFLPQNIDLLVYQNGNLIAQSNSTTNPFELVDFTTTSSSNLKVVIKRVRNSGTDKVILGYNFLKVN